jgi:hypothetical protein
MDERFEQWARGWKGYCRGLESPEKPGPERDGYVAAARYEARWPTETVLSCEAEVHARRALRKKW